MRYLQPYNIITFICIIILILSNDYIKVSFGEPSVSCLDYNGDPVSWWFILSKQSESLNGGGYYYYSSNGIEVEVNEAKGALWSNIKSHYFGVKRPLNGKSLSELITQHTDQAYEDNKPVYDRCTNGKSKVTNKGLCLNSSSTEFFNSQTWFQDQIETEKTVTDEEATNLKLLNPKKPKLHIMHQDLDALADEINDNEKKDKGYSRGSGNTRGKMHIKDTTATFKPIAQEIKDQRPGSSRKAHSKFLVSIDLRKKNGYILDHSANIPSFFEKEGDDYFVFSKPVLFEGDTQSKQSTTKKFLLSHHFFCFNFAAVDYDEIIKTLKVTKAKFVKSNYRTSDGSRALIHKSSRANIAEIMSSPTNDPSSCGQFYDGLYTSLNPLEQQSSKEIVKKLLSSTKLDAMVKNKCLRRNVIKYPYGVGEIVVLAYHSRSQLAGYRDELSDISFEPEDYKMKHTHLTLLNYGIDPYTYVAKTFRGHFFVSTFAQAKRVEIPTIRDDAFSINVVKSWKYNQEKSKDVYRKRHEKILFSEPSNPQQIVCVGDGNRNMGHILYSGLTICFNSQTVANKLSSYVDSINEDSMYVSDNALPLKLDKSISVTPKSMNSFFPSFVQSCLRPDETFGVIDDSTSSGGSDDDSSSSSEYGKKKTPKKKKKPKYDPSKEEKNPKKRKADDDSIGTKKSPKKKSKKVGIDS